MVSPVTAFWSLSDVARKATGWSPYTAIFFWSSSLRLGTRRANVDRGIQISVEDDRLNCWLYAFVWSFPNEKPKSPVRFSAAFKETVRGYRSRVSRNAAAPLREFTKTTHTPEELAEEVSRIEGPQLSLPTLRPTSGNVRQSFWNAVETLRLASKLSPCQLCVSQEDDVRLGAVKWRTNVSFDLRTDPVEKASKVHPPLKVVVSVASKTTSAKREKRLEDSGVYRRIQERMATAGFFGEFLSDGESRRADFKWGSWRLDDVVADFKRVDRVYRSLAGSLK